MKLLEIIKTLTERKRTSGGSNKEIFIHHYLTKNKDNIDIEFDSLPSPMDQICYAAFVNKEKEVLLLVEKIQGEQTSMGMHYSTNLIELLAMSIHNYNHEKENLNNFITNCSLKEFYIVKMIFPLREETPPIPKNDIERIISEILLSNNIPTSLDDITNSTIANSNDLLDLFIIKSALKKVLSLHPDRKLRNDLESFISFHTLLVTSLKNKFKLIVGGIILLFAIAFFIIISFFLISQWDKLGLEPYMAAIPVVFGGLCIIFPIFFTRKKYDLKTCFDSFINKLIAIVR